ncbi:PREDICTED: fractalkine [Miniopterus natalensis]|uniref:fractalkine n=1 Tax=Miniopterus natalensis TaxID=291302 RepID=UPI0007A6C8EA|nr:PREDICTED: fractalkine [Miniopterus natalensis]
MASHLLSRLLGLAALCHLTMLLAGQQHGVNKCSVICDKMTSKIPVNLLTSYRRNEASCEKPAIILTTIKNRTFCADPMLEWVQKAMENLDSKAPPPGVFQKQLSDTIAGSWGTRSPTASKAPDGGPSAGPERTELFNTSAVTTSTSWQSSSAYQPWSELRTEGKSSEATSTQTPSTQALPTQNPSTHQDPSTQAATISHTASVLWTHSQYSVDSMLKNSLGTREVGPISANTDAFMGPGSVPHVSMVPVSSEGAPSREPMISGSWTSKVDDPKRLDSSIPLVPDLQEGTRRQAVGLLAFLGLLFGLGVAIFAYQSLQGCPRNTAGDIIEGLRYVPRSCGSNSYVLVPV